MTSHAPLFPWLYGYAMLDSGSSHAATMAEQITSAALLTVLPSISNAAALYIT